jgi:formate dehydrogenase maturation protein FdhE
MTSREKHMREQANAVLELTKGFTPEKRQTFSNETNMMETLAFYVLELTNEELVFAQVGVCPKCGSTDITEHISLHAVNGHRYTTYTCNKCPCAWE